MPPVHETLPRGRSPFAAAFLSLLFPGLGHAYLGAYRRGLGFAAPPLLLGALVAGFAVRMTQFDLAGLAVQSWFLMAVFIGNLIALAYRGYAIVDAWTISRALTSRSVGRSSSGPSSSGLRQAGLASAVTLGAVLLVMSGIHVAVARYDLLLSDTASCIFDPDATGCDPNDSPGPTDLETEPPDGGTTPAPSIGPAVTGPVAPPWNGKDRLNILLIGADEQGGGHNTDTMITVSIDPTTNQVVMLTLPRDTVDVPVPPGPGRNVWGSVYAGKINSFWVAAKNRSDVFPGATPKARGYNGLKAILGNLYGLDIQYYVEVNFDGFKKVVDALGGVTINVQVPLLDDNFPQPNSRRLRLFVPAGVQHMTGTQALAYARSRKSTSDFERGARQQRLILSLRQQLDIGSVLKNINPLSEAIGQSLRTDIPRELVPQLLGLADRVDTRSIRSVMFTPPFYQIETLSGPRGYTIQPRVSRIRAAVADAFNIDPGFAEARDALAEEGAQLWVLNGSGRTGEAARLSEYLSYLGLSASAPNQKPDTSGLSATTIRVYNGAEDKFPLTVTALQTVFGVQVIPVADPAIRVDFVILTAASTPQLTQPPAP